MTTASSVDVKGIVRPEGRDRRPHEARVDDRCDLGGGELRARTRDAPDAVPGSDERARRPTSTATARRCHEARIGGGPRAIRSARTSDDVADAAARLPANEREPRYPGALPATWLAERMAVDPARIDGMRRAGRADRGARARLDASGATRPGSSTTGNRGAASIASSRPPATTASTTRGSTSCSRRRSDFVTAGAGSSTSRSRAARTRSSPRCVQPARPSASAARTIETSPLTVFTCSGTTAASAVGRRAPDPRDRARTRGRPRRTLRRSRRACPGQTPTRTSPETVWTRTSPPSTAFTFDVARRRGDAELAPTRADRDVAGDGARGESGVDTLDVDVARDGRQATPPPTTVADRDVAARRLHLELAASRLSSLTSPDAVRAATSPSSPSTRRSVDAARELEVGARRARDAALEVAAPRDLDRAPAEPSFCSIRISWRPRLLVHRDLDLVECVLARRPTSHDLDGRPRLVGRRDHDASTRELDLEGDAPGSLEGLHRSVPSSCRGARAHAARGYRTCACALVRTRSPESRRTA